MFDKDESKIIELICNEKTDRDIAALMNFSDKTVERKIKIIKKKLKVTSRVGIAVEALKRAFGNELY